MKWLALLLAVLAHASDDATLIERYPLDTLDGVLAEGLDMRIDIITSSDGGGSLRIRARKPVEVPLFETGDLDVEDVQLVYRAKLRVAQLKGDAFIELRCTFPGGGEFLSQGREYSLSGTTGFIEVLAPFTLRKGENPSNIRLRLVINGKGTVWIDDLRLERRPIPE